MKVSVTGESHDKFSRSELMMKQPISNVTRVLPLLILGLLSACVTRNVYFPAAEAEHAADHIIDAVTKQPGGDQASRE
jgi:hypothetical protein